MAKIQSFVEIPKHSIQGKGTFCREDFSETYLSVVEGDISRAAITRFKGGLFLLLKSHENSNILVCPEMLDQGLGE